MADKIRIKILSDGSVRISTDEISAGNHRQADELLKGISGLLGGKAAITQKRKHKHSHHDTDHDTEHSH